MKCFYLALLFKELTEFFTDGLNASDSVSLSSNSPFPHDLEKDWEREFNVFSKYRRPSNTKSSESSSRSKRSKRSNSSKSSSSKSSLSKRRSSRSNSSSKSKRTSRSRESKSRSSRSKSSSKSRTSRSKSSSKSRTSRSKSSKSKKEECKAATIPPSNQTHLNAHELEDPPVVSRIAFSSCMNPNKKYSPEFWRHMRQDFQPDLWLWLGDNVYADGTDMSYKRRKYNEVREDEYYQTFGPIAHPQIPVMGIWDDHDFGYNNAGGDYPCKAESQREFCIHFDIPPTDVRHPDYVGEEKREGVYSSLLFPPPTKYIVNRDAGGIHVINIDTRINRDILRAKKDITCRKKRGLHVDIIDETQWQWLEKELLYKKSEIKVISSSIQALTPVNRKVDFEDYCAYDKKNESFLTAIEEMQESKTSRGGKEKLDQWSHVPQARARLLHLAQRSMNTGMTKLVLFVSGGLHFGDILAKRMPASSEWGPSQTLYEVVASGIGKNRYTVFPNANRVRLRTCDDQGNGIFFKECKFPFVYEGIEYRDCIAKDEKPWCFFKKNKNDEVDREAWGYCLPEEEEVVPKDNQRVTRVTCGNNYHQTCNVKDKYGGIEVDWEEGKVVMTVFTPTEDVENGIASSITVSFAPEWKRKSNSIFDELTNSTHSFFLMNETMDPTSTRMQETIHPLEENGMDGNKQNPFFINEKEISQHEENKKSHNIFLEKKRSKTEDIPSRSDEKKIIQQDSKTDSQILVSSNGYAASIHCFIAAVFSTSVAFFTVFDT